jgi:hypothetical protein
MRGISTAQDKSSIFNIWQKANGEIWHHPYYFGGLGWTESSKVELTLTPINNTALSAAAWEWDDYFVSIFVNPVAFYADTCCIGNSHILHSTIRKNAC